MNAFVTFPKYVFFTKWCKNNDIILNRKWRILHGIREDRLKSGVKIDHWLVNVEKLTFTRLYLRFVISDSYWKFCDVNDVEILCKFKMAAAKPVVHLSQSTNELAKKFQRLCPIFGNFRGFPIQLSYMHQLFSAENPRNQDSGLQTGNTIISACRWSSNETPTVIPMFSQMPDSAVLCAILPAVVFSWKSKTAVGKQKLVPFLMVHYQPAVICQS